MCGYDWFLQTCVVTNKLVTLKKQNVKSTQEIVKSSKFCMGILTICSNLIIFGLHQPYPRSFNLF